MRRKRQESREVVAPFRQIVKYVMSQAQSLQETVAIAQYHKSGMRELSSPVYLSLPFQQQLATLGNCLHSVHNEGVKIVNPSRTVTKTPWKIAPSLLVGVLMKGPWMVEACILNIPGIDSCRCSVLCHSWNALICLLQTPLCSHPRMRQCWHDSILISSA